MDPAECVAIAASAAAFESTTSKQSVEWYLINDIHATFGSFPAICFVVDKRPFGPVHGLIFTATLQKIFETLITS